eukprot:506129-Rhodomonas_salina.2
MFVSAHQRNCVSDADVTVNVGSTSRSHLANKREEVQAFVQTKLDENLIIRMVAVASVKRNKVLMRSSPRHWKLPHQSHPAFVVPSRRSPLAHADARELEALTALIPGLSFNSEVRFRINNPSALDGIQICNISLHLSNFRWKSCPIWQQFIPQIFCEGNQHGDIEAASAILRDWGCERCPGEQFGPEATECGIGYAAPRRKMQTGERLSLCPSKRPHPALCSSLCRIPFRSRNFGIEPLHVTGTNSNNIILK